MSTIGLSNLVYASITEDSNGNEAYGIPTTLAKAIEAEISVEVADATLFADDSTAEYIKEFQSGTITLGIDDLGKQVASSLIGATIDNNGVLVSGAEDSPPPVAIGFKAKRANGSYRYFWLYRVMFGLPSTNLATKGDGIEFQTPSIEGTIYRRHKMDATNKHPWKAEITEGDANVSPTTVASWFNSVYEPNYTGGTIMILTQPTGLTVTAGSVSGSLMVVATSTAGTLSYQWYQNSTNSTIGGTAVSGATRSTLAIQSTLTAGTYYYYCVVSNGATAAVTTTAEILVSAAPVVPGSGIYFSTQPINQSVTAGSITGSIRAVATTSDNSAITYQWYRNSTNSTSGGTVLSGSNTSTFEIPTNLAVGTYYYYCAAISPSQGYVYSNIVAIVVNATTSTGEITITGQPESTSATTGSINVQLRVLANATDASTLTYQWYSATSATNTSGTPISGATYELYCPSTALAAGTYYYYCVVSSATCTSVKSDPVTLTVAEGTPFIRVMAQPVNKTVTAGSISGGMSVYATASNGAALTYQWYSNSTSSTTGGTEVANATASVLSIPTSLEAGTYYYYCVISSAGLTAVSSKAATVTVLAVGSVVAIINANLSVLQTFVQGTPSARIGIAASASDGSTVSYQWYKVASRVNSGGTAISGANLSTLVVDTSTVGTSYYYVVVSAVGATPVTSQAGAVQITAS